MSLEKRHDGLVPLPAALRAWMDGLTDSETSNIIATNAVELQRHINAGLQGSTRTGPLNLPPVLPEEILFAAKKGATGGTKANPTLSEVLSELGYSPSVSYGPRR